MIAEIKTKLLGFIFLISGILMVIFFPSKVNYQPEGMGKAGISVGLILMFAGIYLLIH